MSVDIHQIWTEAQENSRRLKGCKRPHDFGELRKPMDLADRKRRCSKCGGELDWLDASRYQDGLADGLAAAQERVKMLEKLLLTGAQRIFSDYGACYCPGPFRGHHYPHCLAIRDALTGDKKP